MNAAFRIVRALAASAAIVACRSGERPQSAGGQPAASVPQQPGANVPAADPAAPRVFVPPGDGRISPAQVRSYIAVRRRALELAEQNAGTAPTLLQRLTQVHPAETRAAGELGHDIAEYRWVQARIAEASALPEGAADVLKTLQAAAAEGGARLRRTAEREGQSAAAAAPESATLAHNRAVLEPFRVELAAIEKEHPPSGV